MAAVTFFVRFVCFARKEVRCIVTRILHTFILYYTCCIRTVDVANDVK